MHDRTFSLEKEFQAANFPFDNSNAYDLGVLTRTDTRRSCDIVVRRMSEKIFRSPDLKCRLTEISKPHYSLDIETGAICGGIDGALARYAVPTWHLGKRLGVKKNHEKARSSFDFDSQHDGFFTHAANEICREGIVLSHHQTLSFESAN